MIAKIRTTEYLTRYDNMMADERSAYENKVVAWLKSDASLLESKTDSFDARLQNILVLSMAWNDRECRAFEEGAVLLSALVGVDDTWLPDMLYTKSAKRSVRRMKEALSAVCGEAKEDSAEETASETQDVATFQASAGDGSVGGGNQQGEDKTEDETINHESLTVSQGIVPARPKHIDQYVHLLPKKTQEHAAKYGPLMRELEEWREKERLLIDADNVSAKDREAVAKHIVVLDTEIGSIKKELDSGWNKLVKEGRVVVDDLGNARIINEVKSEEVKSEEPAELTSEQRARRRDLRKWLTDTRRGNGAAREERVKQWYVNFREYLTLEGDKAFEDEKIKDAAKHYGIDLTSLRDKKNETTK